ncbi:hypothetical protein [Listeria monocytogenes]|nr:hypothetical protein [Listeria monocytogenes]
MRCGSRLFRDLETVLLMMMAPGTDATAASSIGRVTDGVAI